MRHSIPSFIYAGIALFLLSSAALLHIVPHTSFAQDVSELQEKITDHSQKIKALEEEIKTYTTQLDAVGREKQTLQGAIKTLDVTQKKVTTDIKVTENRISAADLTIQELEREISIKELQIERDTVSVISSIQAIDELESTSLLETILNADSLTSFWDEIATLEQIQERIRENTIELAQAKNAFIAAKENSLSERTKLSGLKSQLSDEKRVLDSTRSQKNELLSVTQNKEANYQQLLNEKIAARQQFEAEMRAYEAQLSFALDTSKIPTVGSGVMTWPFEPTYMAACVSFASALGNPNCITQYFGNTPFARSGAYNGKGHNGIDFRAPQGTKLTAVLSGTVEATGDTDAYPGCYSYGKWVLVRHNNGLSSLYAHLSLISVAPGQVVPTGGIIGYSGATGYVTGPHLHLTLYASGGVKVQRLSDIPGRPITGCSAASIPVAGLEAYINPLDYLR